MATQTLSALLLEHEARALLARLAMVKPFALQIPMVHAAGTRAVLPIVDRYLLHGRRVLGEMVERYIEWLRQQSGERFDAAEGQRRFAFLRLRFNGALTQLDIFADALCQRSEHDAGVWLAGLDALATDALTVPGGFYRTPPLICYLDRGVGAAIRRARTRLPGGGDNPVAIIRVPRERMVGSGIASSLVHEVGHQAAALLDLVDTLKSLMRSLQKGAVGPSAWPLYERWISEIIADFWSVARIGIGSTLGLIGVVSLPRAFVFRLSTDDPHPMPWLRVKLSCAMGNALYPHRQWGQLAAVWEQLYPRAGLSQETEALIAMIESQMAAFVELLANHRPKALRGQSLRELLATPERAPEQLARQWQSWRGRPSVMFGTAPALAFAVINQAKADGLLQPEQEGPMVANLLRDWATARVGASSTTANGTTRSHKYRYASALSA